MVPRAAGRRCASGNARNSLPTAVTFMAEVRDHAQFETPRQLMRCLGLVPSERSTGDSVTHLGIKGWEHCRSYQLVESAWCYKYAPRIGAQKLYVMDKLPKAVTDIAWMAQSRLCRRYRASTQAGKRNVVVSTGMREMAASMWAIAWEVHPIRVSGTRHHGVHWGQGRGMGTPD